MTNLNNPLHIGADSVLPLQLEKSSFRGRLVRLGPVLDTIINQHAHPMPVARLLGETTVIAAALGTSLKFDGVFTLQVKSEGVVRMLVADVTSDGSVRAYAQYDATRVAEEGGALLGEGYLAFTVDQAETDERYQGIVKLQGDSLAEAVQHYFRQSEQIPTGIMAAVRQDAKGHWHGGGLMLQRMPREGGLVAADTSVEDDWHRAMILMQSCTLEELTDPALEGETLLYRLFHEDGVRVFEAKALRHQCRCSRERVAGILGSLPRGEIEELAVDGIVSVTCEFCNSRYDFDEPQIAALHEATVVPD